MKSAYSQVQVRAKRDYIFSAYSTISETKRESVQPHSPSLDCYYFTSSSNFVMLKLSLEGSLPHDNRTYSIPKQTYFSPTLNPDSVCLPGGVLGISSDGDDRRIFLGLKFSVPGFFWVRKLASIFLGSLICVGI